MHKCIPYEKCISNCDKLAGEGIHKQYNIPG